MRRERGQASIEVLGVLPLLLAAALLVWQLHLAMSAAAAVENAARTGSRVEGLGGDGKRAAMRALPRRQRDDVEIVIDGELVRICSKIPTVVPGVATGLLRVRGSAELPG